MAITGHDIGFSCADRFISGWIGGVVMKINKQYYWLVTLRDKKGMIEERYTSSTNKNMTAKRLDAVKKASSILTAPMVVICCCYLGEMTSDEWDEDWT